MIYSVPAITNPWKGLRTEWREWNQCWRLKLYVHFSYDNDSVDHRFEDSSFAGTVWTQMATLVKLDDGSTSWSIYRGPYVWTYRQ